MRSTQAPVTRVRPWKVAKTGGVGSQLHITILAALNLDFTEWDQAFPNNRLLASATVDRLRHNAYCIELEGPSGRSPKVAPPPSKSKLANGQKPAHS